MDGRSTGSAEHLVKERSEDSDGREEWSDSDSLDLPLYTQSKPSGIRTFLARWYGALLFGLLAVTFVATWASTIALTWRLASEQSCTAVSSEVDIPSAAGSHPTHNGGSHSPAKSESHGTHASPHDSSHGGHDEHAGTGHLHIPGFRLAYNASYCNGVRDPTGARARGCIFDPVQTGWMPGLCVDTELTDAFIASHEWQWFEDEALTRPTTQETVLRGFGGRDAFTIDDYHYRHCEYIMKQLIRNVIRQPNAIGFKGLDEEHLEHCLDRLINYNTPELREAWTEHLIWTGSGECYERIVPVES